ncbi:MAG: hypothetical protein A2X86_18055 [Bdellovibrionales bacterium GWA2_49_15]|nr:MAG: hypothetical protein A2X86_18055 [Bdellovibrionales bacterium GWA2_49_15]HAZ11629.1 hypothetical protein [Bdellovibrionales bacterium]
MDSNFSQIILWRNFSNIQKVLNLSDDEYARFLNIGPKTFRTLTSTKAAFPLDIAATLSEKLFFDLADFLEKDLDMDAIYSAYFKIEQLPERYRPAAFCRARSLAHVLDYVERKQGKLRKNIILRKFQTNGAFFKNLDNAHNIHFNEDLTAHLHHLGYDKSDFFQMGQNSVHLNSKGPVQDCLREAKSVKNGVEIFFECVSPMFDRTHHYKITTMTKDKIILDAPRNKEAQDALHTKIISNEHLCQLKLGIFSAVPLYLGIQQYLPVKKTRSVFEGAPSNVYELDLSVLSHLSGISNTTLSPIYQ